MEQKEFENLLKTYDTVEKSYKNYKRYLADEKTYDKLNFTIFAPIDSVDSSVGTYGNSSTHSFFDIENKGTFNKYFHDYINRNKSVIIEDILKRMANDIKKHKDTKIKILQEEIDRLNNIGNAQTT